MYIVLCFNGLDLLPVPSVSVKNNITPASKKKKGIKAVEQYR